MTGNNRRNLAILASLLFAALLAAYANHFYNGFHFDDSHAVVDNVHIRDLKNIPSFFTDPRMFSADPLHWGLRSLVTTSLAIDYWLGGGLNPFYFQLSTFIWFVLLGVLMFFIYSNLLKRSINHSWTGYLALAATAWYLLHTANAETLNYVIARSDVLSTFCIAASLLVYIACPAMRKWGLYIIAAFAGVFAKETVLVLVILVFFYLALFEYGLSVTAIFKRKNIRVTGRIILKILPLFLVVAATQLYTLSKISSVPGISNPFLPYLLTQTYVWVHYFIAFFLPLNLSADTDWTIIPNYFDERIIIGILFVAGLVVIIFKASAKKENRPIAFGLIWFAAALLPTSVAPFAEVTNDHRMFFPFIGLALSVVSAVGLWLMKYQKQLANHRGYRVLLGACTGVVLLLNAYGVYRRNQVWKDDETLWYDVTIKSPLNGRGLMNYGLTQMAKGNYPVAERYFEQAKRYLPYYNTLYINIGILKGATNKPQEAIENFDKAILYSPSTFDSYVYYARYLQQVGRHSDAAMMAEKALAINPYSVMAFQVLMAAYNDLGAWDKLQQTAQKALALLPGDPTAQRYLAIAAGRPALTGTDKQKAKPLTAADEVNLSLIYYNQQNYTKCIQACQAALKLQPVNADAYSNMGAAYNQLKQWQKGMEACTRALQLNPNHKLAAGNLNWAKSKVKK